MKIGTRMGLGQYQILFDFICQGHNCSFVGPGHGSVAEVDGEWWLLYHAWVNGESMSRAHYDDDIPGNIRKNKLITGAAHADG